MPSFILLLLLATCGPAVDAGLEPRGSGRLTWLWFEVYDATLYLPPGEPDPLAATARRIEFTHLRPLSAGDLAAATTRAVGERTGAAERAEVDAGVAALNRLWPAVARGDRIVLDYRPGPGTALLRNGALLGTVPGEAFARTLFSVWIGPDPIDAGLRTALLGGG